MNLAYAEKINPAHQGMRLPDRYKEYAIKVDGKVVGEIKWTYRPKNAGGSAWQASFKIDTEGFRSRTVFNKDFKKLLVELRPAVEDEVRIWDREGPSIIAHRTRFKNEVAALVAAGMSQNEAESEWHRLENIRIYAEIDAAEIAQ